MTPPDDTTTYHTTMYSTTEVTLNALRQWTQDVLTGSVLSVSDTPSPSLDVVYFICYAVINNNAGLTPVMQQVASSLTTSMRTTGNEPLASASLSLETYVHARWDWVTLPLILLAFTLVFMISAVVVSIVKGVPTWKSSSLPAFVYQFDPETSSAIGSSGPRLSKLEKQAEEYSMMLSVDYEPWRFDVIQRIGGIKSKKLKFSPILGLRQRR